MNNKMKGYVNINNKKYYKVVAEESKYMLFKSKDDFKKIEKLERMLYDLVRFAVSGKDTKEIILSRMKEIEKYLESLKSEKSIRIKVIDENLDLDDGGEKPFGYDSAFDIIFSTLEYYFYTIYFGESWNFKMFYRKLKTEGMKQKYRDLFALVPKVFDFI